MNKLPHPLAYLVSAYPATSHTFILREVIGLRERGWPVSTVSINRDRRDPATLGEVEAAEQRNTLVIKDWPRWRILSDLLSTLLRYGTLAVLGALVETWRLSRPGWRGQALALAYWLEAMLLAGWLARRNIQHVHVHFGNEAALVGLLVKRITGCLLSYTIHGPDEFHDAHGQQLAAKVAAADHIVCISQFARSQLMLFSAPQHWHKMEVVRLGVGEDFQMVEPASHPVLRLLCVGRLSAAKGQHLLLRAVSRLQQGGVAVSLVLAGGGPDDASLHQEAARLGLERVRFTGPQPREAVRALYRQADVFVLPSFAEGIPVVLMEAMASGLPCVSTRIAGIPELIADGRTGLLLPPGDEDALFEALLLLAGHPELRQRLGQRARAAVHEHYWLERNLDRLAGQLLAMPGEVHHA
ncbi:glycosyltransferase family 4 protein [Chitinilyticum piscinae]|uniref:Glycosyltransferase family 4 protein n=1 Tax=Chitinilyticum piscinae TaxID=2866724 RepID=A0A8J7K256_9NEIS|nr:glycosyltransferase family 4 protein [Chitinilyticum piscinae]MBE9609562.1 glycosyltransferase family 4 protein [Chitinilyticum piscinae]